MEDGDTVHWPGINPNREAFWISAYGLELRDEISTSIQLAFSNVRSFPLKRIMIQFWKPGQLTASGDVLLSCCGFPFALSHANRLLLKYRSGCEKYMYCVSGKVNDPLTIYGAPLSSAILNHFSQVVLDLSVHRGTPLVNLALECELTCSLMLPVFNQTQCIGVIEVSMRNPAGLVVIFNELKFGLKMVGLSINPPESFVRPHKVIKGLEPTVSELKCALRVASETLPISVCHVWHSYTNLNLCRLEDMERVLLGKLQESCFGDRPGDVLLRTVMMFYQDLWVLPLENAEGLIGRALETHKPHLCRNIYELSGNSGVLTLLSANIDCSCFVMPLRSSHTGELDYVFEFFWPNSLNHLTLMEKLLSTLRDCLPSFKFASGAQLGDELLVVDVENSSSWSPSKGGSTSIKIFPGSKMSITHEAVETTSCEGESDINQANQHPLTYINNPENQDDDDLVFLAVYKLDHRLFFLPSSPKANQHPLTYINNPENQDDDDLVFLAVYKLDHRLFFLPSSPTFVNLMEKIKQEFEHELNSAVTFKVKYQVVTGKWHSLTDDICLERCISSYRTSKSIDYIKLYVLAVEK